MKRLRVRDSVMTSHDACTSGTLRVLTVASLERLKMETYSSTRRLWSDVPVYDKVFECTEHIADRNSSALPGLLPHTARRSTHLLQEFGWEVFNHHPSYSPDLAPSDIHLFLHLKKFLYRQRQRFQNDREAEMSVTVVPIPSGRLLRHRIQKIVPMVRQMFQFRRWICWKIVRHLLYLFE